MKHGILTLVLVASTLSLAFAGNVTKAENDAAIQKSHIALLQKTKALENNLKNRNKAAFKEDVSAIVDLMHKRMDQERAAINFEPGITAKMATERYNAIEMTIYRYTQLSKDPDTNGQRLLDDANSFVGKY